MREHSKKCETASEAAIVVSFPSHTAKNEKALYKVLCGMPFVLVGLFLAIHFCVDVQ